ncbi:MAG: hypothetical protein HQ580_04445 [Planctomycetes bacterium]|nr:hypothetical protein [Planctomycetota bacterium]
MLSKSDAADVKNGRPRTNITNIADIKTDWLYGARNVQIQQPIAVEDGVPLRVDRLQVFIPSFHLQVLIKEYLKNVKLVVY